MNKVECKFTNTEEWDQFVDSLGYLYGTDYFVVDHQSVSEGEITFYTWNVEMLRTLVEDEDNCEECELTDFRVEKLSESKWQEIKEKFGFRIEAPLDVEQIREIFKSQITTHYEKAFKSLSLIGVEQLSIAPELVALLKDSEDRKLRTQIAYYLSRMEDVAVPALPLYIKELKRDDIYKPAVFIQAIGSLGEKAKSASNEIIHFLKNYKGEFDYASVFRALSRIGVEKSKIIPLMKEVIEDSSKSPTDRNIALYCLLELPNAKSQEREYFFTLFNDDQIHPRVFLCLIAIISKLELSDSEKEYYLKLFNDRLEIEEDRRVVNILVRAINRLDDELF